MSNFAFFNDIFVQDEAGSGFGILSSNSIVVMGNPFHNGSQTYLKKVSVDGTVLETGNVLPPGGAGGISGAMLTTLSNGDFAIVGQGSLGNSSSLDIKYNVYDANFQAKFQSDHEALIPAVPFTQVDYSIFSTTNGFGIATTESTNSGDTIGGLPGSPGTAARGSDVRASLYDLNGTEVTNYFLVQNAGSGLAGNQVNVHTVQLSNGTFASVFGDTEFFSENSSTNSHQFYATSLSNNSGALISAYDFAGTQGGDPGVPGFGQIGLTALTGGGFVAAVTLEESVINDGVHHHTHLVVQRFNNNGTTNGAPIDVGAVAFGFSSTFDSKQFEGTDSPIIRGTSDGGFVVIARTGSYYHSEYGNQAAIAKFDANGNLVASQLLANPFGQTSLNIEDMQIAPDGEIMLKLRDQSTNLQHIMGYILQGPNDSVQTANPNGGTTTATGTGTDWLMGSTMNDTLVAAGTGTRMFGGQGKDMLVSGPGNDILDGGVGFDTAVFSGTRSVYAITHQIDGTTSVADTRNGSPNGTDTLVNIERLKFSDAVVASNPAAVSDFNTDGFSDLLWRNTSNGDVVAWNFNGSNGYTGQDFGAPTSGWQIQSTGDFNGDGNADLLWRNTSSGNVVTWNFNGSGGYTGQDFGAPTSNWQVQEVGDFNGDGNTDIFWRSSSNGEIVAWYFNGSGGYTGVDFGTVNSYQIQGAGDFNADGKCDLLWRDPLTGDVTIWDFNNSGSFSGYGFGAPTSDWKIKGVGDFNGDGTSDILWRNTSNGDVVVWNFNTSNGYTGQDFGAPTSDWQVQGVSDFNGDGKSDILWRNTNGDVVVWNFNGSGGYTGQDFGAPTSNWNPYAGNDTLFASVGNPILISNPGNTTFVIGPGAGNDTIENFRTSQDTLQFNPSLFANFAAAMSHATQVGSNTVFAVDANDSVTLQNVTLSNLNATNFHFA